METTTFAHGARVRVSAVLERRTERVSGRTFKVWRRVERTPFEALYLGHRSLRDGFRDFEDEVGAVFYPKGPTVPAALVSSGPSRKPFFAPVDAIEVLRSSGSLVALVSSEIGDAIAAHDAGETVRPLERALAVAAGIDLGPSARRLPGFRIVSRAGVPIGNLAPSTPADASTCRQWADGTYPADAPHRAEFLVAVVLEDGPG